MFFLFFLPDGKLCLCVPASVAYGPVDKLITKVRPEKQEQEGRI